MDKKKYNKQWREQHKAEIAEYSKQYYQDHKDYFKEYYQKHKNNKECNHQHYLDNKETILNRNKKWREKNPDYNKQYGKTLIGRARKLISAYKAEDKKHNRGECTLTPQWVVDNIFSKPCIYCGETGWDIMGCDRIDNSKPHTPDNVVPCCEECNKKRGRIKYEDFILKIIEK